jgi:23S rRNA (uracil1939-C5)-methyltransferase
MTYEGQLAWKQGLVRRLVGRFGTVEPILGMENPYHYRNKVQAAFTTDRKGRILSGVYQSGTHRVVPVDSCLLEDEVADRIIVTIRRMLPRFHLTAYDERTRRGFLRHVLVKRGFASGQVMVVLVTGTPVFPSKNAFVAELLRRHPEITTVVQNVNRAATSLVLGTQEKTLYGAGSIEETLCGLSFRISPQSFYQINPLQTEVLYRKALEFANLTGKERVLDAYCGVGTIGLCASRQAAEVVGVEVNRDAVRDAIANARRNNVTNAWFICADAGDYMVSLAGEGEPVDVVMMDPPRAGSSPEFLESLTALAPKRVVYISCNPETLARDLIILTDSGWRVQAIQPVDMFPHTRHVEVVTLLTRDGV